MARAKNNELRQRILTTAFRLFYDKGLDAVLVKDIAAECGISVSLLHHYYSRKEDILVHIFYDMIYKVQVFILEHFRKNDFGASVPDVIYLHLFYRLFYDILQRENNKLLRIYSKVLFDTELLQSATDQTFASGRGFTDFKLSNEERLSVYTLNGGMAQIVSLYLSKHNVLTFDLNEQLERQMQLLYYSAGLSQDQRMQTVQLVNSKLTQEHFDECYHDYMSKVTEFINFDW